MSAVNSEGEAKNIKRMWTDLTLTGNMVTRSLFLALDSLLSAAPFRDRSQGTFRLGAKGLIFPAAAPESQTALAENEAALSLSLLGEDGAWILLTRLSVPTAPLLRWLPMFALLSVECSVLTHNIQTLLSDISKQMAPIASEEIK